MMMTSNSVHSTCFSVFISGFQQPNTSGKKSQYFELYIIVKDPVSRQQNQHLYRHDQIS
jgi:hypothetical protein